MRHIHKASKPNYLVENEADLTAAYLASLQTDKATTPWRHASIRSALFAETSERCAYCDSEIRAVAYEHVEHIEPKSVVPHRVVDWSNLTIACPKCNQNKLDYHSLSLPLLNPYLDNPPDHLDFAGPMVIAKPGDSRGDQTVMKLKLYRWELVKSRSKRIEHILRLLDKWKRAIEPDLKETLATFIIEDFESGEYRETVRSYLEQVGFLPRPEACEVHST